MCKDDTEMDPMACKIWGLQGDDQVTLFWVAMLYSDVVGYLKCCIKRGYFIERIVLLDFIHRLVSQKIEE
jgi:hypothetical protein